MRYDNRNVLVTGGASGIGLALVQQFLREGARVAVLDANAEAGATALRDLQDYGSRLVFVETDVGSFEGCERAHAAVVEKIGVIDTLVNNAGISPKRNGRGLGVDELSAEEWLRVLAVNLNAPFFLTKLVVPGMKAQRFGRIISMSSVAGKAYLDVVAVHYAATKAALIGLTRQLAGELGAHGITANAIAPGRIDTALVAMSGAEANARIVDATPLKRLGSTQEVADVCAFLATRDEAAFVTGQVIDVAGGWLMT